MLQLFAQIFNMSVSASYIVLAVLLLRLALKKAPRWMTLLLWGAVGVRLICPFTFESMFSLIPSVGQIHQRVAGDPVSPDFTEISYLNGLIQQVDHGAFEAPSEARVELLRLLLPILGWVWVFGILALLAYGVVSYLKVRGSVITAVRREEGIYQTENVKAPFVLGFVKPKIYLPFSMDEKNTVHVVAHEKAHIRRLDHLWKPLGFVILAVYWFHPLMWLGYLLFCRDIEFACDEKVIKGLDRDSRADYSQALLSCSVGRPRLTALAFGEVGVQKRIKAVLSYKMPAFWVVIVAVTVCIAAMFCFCTEPVNVYNMGVQRVTVERISDDQVELQIKYSGCYGKFGVRLIPDTEGEYIGDGMIDYDGALGKNRILVSFGDDEPTRSLARQLNYGAVAELENSPVRILTKWASPGDHGFCIYFGMDENIQLGEIRGERLQGSGTIKIPIRILSPGE